MSTRELAIDDLASIASLDEGERALQMTEDAFRVFYEQTARPLWIYLARTTSDPRLADDLLQEAYYRLLRARPAFESDEHRRHYLFRIATNLVRDQRRRPRLETPEHATSAEPAAADTASRSTARIDVTRAMDRLKPRDRAMLWLAYAQGCSHEEIAGILGVKTASLKALLHRARRRLAGLLGEPPAAVARRGGRS